SLLTSANSSIRQPPHLDALEKRLPAIRMRLQGERALGQLAIPALKRRWVLRLGVIDDGLVIQLDRDVLAVHFDVILEPLIVLGRRIFYVNDPIQASSAPRIGRKRIVDLCF